MVVMAIIQFGLVFNSYLNLTDAVRAGARVAAVSAAVPNPRATAIEAVRDAANGLDDGSLAVDAQSSWEPGSNVIVTASHPYSISIFGIPVWSGRLSGSTTERVE